MMVLSTSTGRNIDKINKLSYVQERKTFGLGARFGDMVLLWDEVRSRRI